MKQIFIILVAMLLFSTTGFSQDTMYVHKSDSTVLKFIVDEVDSIIYYYPQFDTGSFVDSRDSVTYKWAKIGEQIWMAENLKVSVAEVDTTGGTADGECGINDVFVWDNTAVSYGKLYSWQAALKACPSGWHLPSEEEWSTLITYVGDNGQSGNEGLALRASTGWGNSANGTDNFSFAALPSGYRKNDGMYKRQGSNTYWWENTLSEENDEANCRCLDYLLTNVSSTTYKRNTGCSIRCVKD